MPWCDGCAKYWAPSSMNDDGTCPRCGADLDPPALAAPRDGEVEVDGVDEKAPWHFKLMVVALVVYLVYRFGSMFFG
jgi:hypothetical protein